MEKEITYEQEQGVRKMYSMKIDDARNAGREDAAQALCDVEDAINGAYNLKQLFGVDLIDTARLILDESHRRRIEHRAPTIVGGLDEDHVDKICSAIKSIFSFQNADALEHIFGPMNESGSLASSLRDIASAQLEASSELSRIADNGEPWEESP